MATAVPVITRFEMLTYWGFANGYLEWFGINSLMLFWAWFVTFLVLRPVIHARHFYFDHRLLHPCWLYKLMHALQHPNVEVGIWSGLAMHPVEHIIYFSTIVFQWRLALHWVSALWKKQFAIFNTAVAHTGFEKLVIGKHLLIDASSYFHYLQNKYLECNYGDTLAPLDKLLQTRHEGTAETHLSNRGRMLERLAQANSGKG